VPAWLINVLYPCRDHRCREVDFGQVWDRHVMFLAFSSWDTQVFRTMAE
jgi:hypothetical protein